MSQQLINHSADLLRLRNEGYDISIREDGYLLVKQVPYVNASRKIMRGTLICKLDLSGNKTSKPSQHDAYWQGETPCHSDGNQIATILNSIGTKNLGNGLVANARFSAKADYRDFYHKVTTYVGRIWGEAAKLDSNATPLVFAPISDDKEDDIFEYIDTASSRADIGTINEKLSGLRIGIVGLGGTGSYILDMVSKTWVAEIHLIDGDDFLQHNAFRAPSAASIDDLKAKLSKVEYFAKLYANMRRGICPHPVYMNETNVQLLEGLDFVFICVDNGEAKKHIVTYCEANDIPFIDVGMGALMDNDQIGGIIRTVVSTPDNRVRASKYISYDDSNPEYVYTSNIQIAELNSLNASIAVMLWKKYYGMYRDTRTAHVVQLSIASGEMIIEGDQ